jgi:hypothetical protein
MDRAPEPVPDMPAYALNGVATSDDPTRYPTRLIESTSRAPAPNMPVGSARGRTASDRYADTPHRPSVTTRHLGIRDEGAYSGGHTHWPVRAPTR